MVLAEERAGSTFDSAQGSREEEEGVFGLFCLRWQPLLWLLTCLYLLGVVVLAGGYKFPLIEFASS